MNKTRIYTAAALCSAALVCGSAVLATPKDAKSKAQKCDDDLVNGFAKCLKEKPHLTYNDCWNAHRAGWIVCRKAAGKPVRAFEKPPGLPPNTTRPTRTAVPAVRGESTPEPGVRRNVEAVAEKSATPTPTPKPK